MRSWLQGKGLWLGYIQQRKWHGGLKRLFTLITWSDTELEALEELLEEWQMRRDGIRWRRHMEEDDEEYQRSWIRATDKKEPTWIKNGVAEVEE
jgi:hypothetical protein